MGTYQVQVDFLGAIKTDKKSILPLTWPDLHYVMLFIVKSKTTENLLDYLIKLESKLESTTSKLFFHVSLLTEIQAFDFSYH